MKWLFIGVVLFIVGCSDNGNKKTENFIGSTNIDEPQNVDSFQVLLGKELFFDTRLSKNNNISCASCHNPLFAFADTNAANIGTNGQPGFRNPPSLVNVGSKSEFHLDGGVRTLELQVLAPIIDTNELGQNFDTILAYLNSNLRYQELFKDAFDSIPTIFGMTRAIASYERSLNYQSSKFDKFLAGDTTVFSDSQIRGWELFNSSRLNCNSCHSGELLTNRRYYNIGIQASPIDSGRARVTGEKEDRGKFVVPSLKNVLITAPYMHDGSIHDINDVLVFFENGGGSHSNKTNLLKPFQLSSNERKDLLEFFGTLTDQEFINN